MKKPLIITLLVVCALFFTCTAGSIIGVVWIGTQSGPPEGITMTITMPSLVSAGESFDVVITVTNHLDRARVIRDIDFWDPLMDGVQIESIDPQPKSTDLTMGIDTYSMGLGLDPGGTVDITFHAKALVAGMYSGDIDVYVDSMLLNCMTETRTVVISESP